MLKINVAMQWNINNKKEETIVIIIIISNRKQKQKQKKTIYLLWFWQCKRKWAVVSGSEPQLHIGFKVSRKISRDWNLVLSEWVI